MSVSRESSQVLPSQLLPCHYSRGAIQAVFPRGADFFHPSPRQRKASSNSMTAFQLTSASFLIPCGLGSCFKQHHSNKMIFQEPLWGSSSAPRHGSAVGSALSPCFGPSMPCPKPQGSYPTPAEELLGKPGCTQCQKKCNSHPPKRGISTKFSSCPASSSEPRLEKSSL